VLAGFKFTIIGSTGGFLRDGNTTLLIGTEDEDVENLMELLSFNSKAREQIVNMVPFEATPAGAFIPSPIKVPVGGAVVFVLPVERYERF